MNIISYLRTAGFKEVPQNDYEGWLYDPDYLYKDGVYCELHDDNKFYLWVDEWNPIYETTVTENNLLKVKLKVIEILSRYDISIKLKEK